MKRAKNKIITTLLAVTMAFSLTACGVTQENVDTTVNTAIAPVSEQITAINTSIDELKTVDTELEEYITALQTTVTALENSDTANTEDIAAINALIETLQTKDTALDGKIETLETYVDTEITATEDWAKATFATLAQYDNMQTEISGIKQSLTAYVDTTELSTAISTSETGMKTWVNETLADGYYDIATTNAKLAEIQAQITTYDDTQIKEDIAKQAADLTQAKTDLTAEYKAAIENAITENHGEISGEITAAVNAAKEELQTKIDGINTELTTIKENIQTLNNKVAELENKITELENRINCLEGKHETETSYVYTWSETAPTSTKNYTCLHCEKTIEETVSPSVWSVGDKVTYIAKDGKSYVSTVGEVTDGKAVLVSDDWYSKLGKYSEDNLLALLEPVGARFPIIGETAYTTIIEPWLMETLYNTYSVGLTEDLSAYKYLYKYDGNMTNGDLSTVQYYNTTWIYRYIWDIVF